MSEKMPDCGCGHPDRHRELYRTENLGGFGYYCRYCRGLARQDKYHHDDKYRALRAEVERLRSVLEITRIALGSIETLQTISIGPNPDTKAEQIKFMRQIAKDKGDDIRKALEGK